MKKSLIFSGCRGVGSSKKGEMLFGQIAKTILAVGVVFLLLLLVARIFVPMFDRGDETAKSYLKTLKGQLDVAEDRKVGEFFMWYFDSEGENKEFFLVYFGDGIMVDYSIEVLRAVGGMGTSTYYYETVPIPFNSLGRNSNRICVCYIEKGKSTCRSCEDLDYPVRFNGTVSDDGSWYKKSGKRISIKLVEKEYVFSEIK